MPPPADPIPIARHLQLCMTCGVAAAPWEPCGCRGPQCAPPRRAVLGIVVVTLVSIGAVWCLGQLFGCVSWLLLGD